MDCRCNEIMGRTGVIYMHLSGCEEDWETQEYDRLPWWKRILTFNPRHLYDY